MQQNELSIVDVDLLLAWGATFHHLKKGQVLFCEGGEAHFYYQLVEGRIKMCNCNKEGKEFIQGMFETGESFGESPLFDGSSYVASAVADEYCVITRLQKENFLQLMKENFDIHFSFTQTLARRLRFKSVISKEISSYGPQHRVSTLLKEYKKDHGINANKLFKVDLTRQQIADMTGLRVETVIRSIRMMYEKGEVKIKRGKVYC